MDNRRIPATSRGPVQVGGVTRVFGGTMPFSSSIRPSAFARRNIRRKTPTAISRVNPAETDMEMRSTPIGLIKVDLERA